MAASDAAGRGFGVLTPTDYQNGRIRRLRLRGRWLLPPDRADGRFEDGVRYAIAVDDEAWLVVWRYGSNGGVVPTTRWYADAAAAIRDGVPAGAVAAAGLLAEPAVG